MAQENVAAMRGLHTDASELVRPPGSLTQADNCDVERPGVVEVRKGFEVFGQDNGTRIPSGGLEFPSSLRRAAQIFDESDDADPQAICGWWDDGELFATDNTGSPAYAGTGVTTAAPPGAAKVRFLRTDAGVYVTTDAGVYRFGLTGSRRAGLLPPAFFTAIPTSTGAGVLPAESAHAYRCINIRILPSGQLQQSAPSGRFVLTTSQSPSAGRATIAVQIALPSDAQEGDVIALYRSRSPVAADGAGLALPSDEMFLVGSVALSASNITAGNIVITDDKAPDELPALNSNQAPQLLYTSPTADGIAEANDVPPIAADIELYQNHVFFAQPRREFLSFFVYPLNSVDNGGTDNIAAGDTITINGTSTVVLTSANNPIPANGEFWNSADIVNDYTVVLGVNESMNEVLVSLIAAAINATSDQHGVYAQVAERASSLTRETRGGVYWPADPRRRIVLRSLTDAPFSVEFSSSVTGANAPFRDEAGDLDGRTLNSQTDAVPNGLAFSKPDQPEAAPLLRSLRVGSDAPITRIKALRNSLMIFKRDGVFRLTGTDITNFRVTLIDPRLELLAPETVAVLDNEVYGFFDEGVFALTETSKRRVSRAIDHTINVRGQDVQVFVNATAAENRQALFQYAVGGAYEEDLKYFLGLPAANDEYPDSFFVYCKRTGEWSKWDFPATSIVVDSAKRLLFADKAKPWISRQRRRFQITDFCDFSNAWTVTSVSATSLDIAPALAGHFDVAPAVGDAVVTRDAFDRFAQSEITGVTALAAGAYRIDITEAQGDSPSGHTSGECGVHAAISTRLQVTPLYGGRFGVGKQYDQLAMLFAALRIVEGRAGFATDISSNETQVAINNQWRLVNGFEPWVPESYAGTPRPGTVMVTVPRQKQRASQLTLSWECADALAQWRLQGLSLTFAPETEAFKR